MKMENNFNGDPYLKISNLLLGAIVNSKNFLTEESKIFMIILFKTIGFQKDKDWLTYKQISKFTGINLKQNIYRAIKKLKDKKLIIKEGKYFKINQNYEEWLTLDNENIEKIKEFYQSKKLRNSVTNDNKKVIKSDYQSNKKVSNLITKVIKSDYSKSANMITPSTDKTITDKTITDNIYSPDDPIDDFFKKDKNKETRKQIEEVVSYLNEKANKNFRSNNKKAVEKITARINEGFNLDDFKKVINIKASKWKDTEYDDYLRPETLFGGKFESYLNEKPAKKGVNKNGYIERDKSPEWFDEFQRRKSKPAGA
jgi:phage replication O-like protein O